MGGEHDPGLLHGREDTLAGMTTWFINAPFGWLCTGACGPKIPTGVSGFTTGKIASLRLRKNAFECDCTGTKQGNDTARVQPKIWDAAPATITEAERHCLLKLFEFIALLSGNAFIDCECISMVGFTWLCGHNLCTLGIASIRTEHPFTGAEKALRIIFVCS